MEPKMLEAIEKRRSIRKYKSGEIPRAHIESLLTAAMLAPSAVNSRPWEFVAITNEGIRAQIAEALRYGRFIAQAPLAIVVCGLPDSQRGIGEGYWMQDCAAATENILLQAQSLGYGSCWCGVYPNAERVAAIAQITGVTSVPFGVIAVGEAAEAPDSRGFYEASKVRFLE